MYNVLVTRVMTLKMTSVKSGSCMNLSNVPDAIKSSFTQKELLIEHNSLVHGAKKPYPCSRCDASFLRKNELTQHIELVHVKSNGHEICTICESGYRRYY